LTIIIPGSTMTSLCYITILRWLNSVNNLHGALSKNLKQHRNICDYNYGDLNKSICTLSSCAGSNRHYLIVLLYKSITSTEIQWNKFIIIFRYKTIERDVHNNTFYTINYYYYTINLPAGAHMFSVHARQFYEGDTG